MAITRGPKIVKSGLVLALDAADRNSYIGSGAVWSDLSGNNNTGTLINSPTFSSLNGGSVVLDGVNEYIVDSSISSFNVGCINIWIKPTTIINASSTGTILMQLRYGVPANSSWYIALGSITSLLTNEYITITNPSNDTRTAVADGGSLLANTWVNIVINWESTIYKIYINNIVKTTSAAVGGNVGQLTVPNTYVIGSFQINNTAVYSGFFPGSVATTKLYNRTLTATEVLQNFQATRTRFGV